jgi:ADP-ribose pyrophosphatase
VHQIRVDDELVYDGNQRIAHRGYRDESGNVTHFDIVLQRPGVVVLAITDDGRFVLTRQFRPGPERVMWDLPGGFIDDGEAALDAARRELAEETGHEADRLAEVGVLYPSAYSTECRTVVVATGCRRTRSQETDPSESIAVAVVGFEDLREILRAGEMTAVDAAYLALDHLEKIDSPK